MVYSVYHGYSYRRELFTVMSGTCEHCIYELLCMISLSLGFMQCPYDDGFIIPVMQIYSAYLINRYYDMLNGLCRPRHLEVYYSF
jgi:hypothetical protein